MKILSYNPGHDGSIAYIADGRLMVSIEAEKNSNYRYSPISSQELLEAFAHVDEVPDVVCTGGWWPGEDQLFGSSRRAGYRGVDGSDTLLEQRRMFGRDVQAFSSSHERSHLLCAFGLSDLPVGTPCYALVWEGTIGAFYEIDEKLGIRLIGDVLTEPGNRYASIYGLADPSFPKDAPFSRFSDAGKLMALASFATRSIATAEEERLIDFLLSVPHVQLSLYDGIEAAPHYNAGVDDPKFRNFAGIFSDRIFDAFYQFAERHMPKRLPLLIAGGCGLNCDWNSRWADCGLFESIFVPPVANDSGSAIGTAIDAQLHLTGNPKVEWSVYSGLAFEMTGAVDRDQYDVYDADCDLLADMLAAGCIITWVNGRYEIGPRALGNRSILAAPFDEQTRVRLNQIKQREQFRPIAPVCLLEDAGRLFGCQGESPYMLYTYRTQTDALAAVTHVNGTARIQTVSPTTNAALHELLTAFKQRTGFGVLCNTSLNFNGRGFINTLGDLSAYTLQHELDGFAVGASIHMRKSSAVYRAYRANARQAAAAS